MAEDQPNNTEKTEKKAKRTWFKRNKITIIVLGVIAFLVVLCSVAVTTADNQANKVQNASADSSNSGSSGGIPVDNSPNTSQYTPAQQTPTCTSYQAIDDQTWLEIVKDPDSYTGQCYTVYGEVTQFDAATGTTGFRANVGGTAQTPSYGFVDYPTNTTLVGSASTLSSVVEQDLFTANVMVLGAYTYKTQIGGQTTVPQLQVDSITVTSTASS